MPHEYTLMPSPVGQLTLVARDGKLSAILWECERANRVRLGGLLCFLEATTGATSLYQSLGFERLFDYQTFVRGPVAQV